MCVVPADGPGALVWPRRLRGPDPGGAQRSGPGGPGAASSWGTRQQHRPHRYYWVSY